MRRNMFFALAFISLAAVSAASPEPSRAEDSSSRFGAIAFSPSTRMYGYVYDYADKDSARKGAIEECKEEAGSNDCKAVVQFENGCGALAVGDIGYGTGWGDALGTAQRYALDSCSSWTGGCHIVRWVCTTNAAPENADSVR